MPLHPARISRTDRLASRARQADTGKGKNMSKREQAQYAWRMPDHLPRKLCIDCWIWNWIVAATPGEPYADLERCMTETTQRGFNAVRVETGLNWAFTLNGTPRGPMEFGPWIAGHGWNWNSVNARGGGRHDVLERLIHLFELAKRHGVWVILTSWEYQDSSWFIADPRIRAEVYSIPTECRFMHLAEQHHRLLNILKAKGLEKNIAFVEVHNEPECSDFPKGPENKRLHQEAIAMLRMRHPDILISGDFASHDYSIIPDNAQVFDQHIYAGAEWHFKCLYGQTVLNKEFNPAQPRALEPMQRVLKDDLIPWEEFMKPAQNVREFWRPIMWLYENLDNAQWDLWAAEKFNEWKDRIRAEARKRFTEDAREARRRQLPLVLDEGGFFYPPRLSRFELSPAGLALLDYFTDLAIECDYWGFMPGTYCGPEHLIWHENPGWLRRTNERFRK